MKAQELRMQTKEELHRLANELRTKVRNLKFELVQGKAKNTALLRLARKDLARVETLIKEKI